MYADPHRALWLVDHGARLRTGRSVGRTIYIQTGDEASKSDLLIGVMDSPALADMLVRVFNQRQTYLAQHEVVDDS